MTAASGAGTAGTVVTSSSLLRVPPGPATLLLANNGSAGTVFVGAGTNVTTAGFPVPAGAVSPVVVPLYAGSPAGTWSAVVASGSATLAWIISDPSGGTGP
jgi:hypothetical protein